MQPSRWWSANLHADRRPLLVARNRIKSAIRAWFEAEGFTEVDTALLQVSPGNETHLHAFRTEMIGTDLERATRYLPTSPEFAMKKLLAAGEDRIFTFAPVFRNRERGPLHAPEFTMLEWYRAGEGYQRLWEDCSYILRIAAGVSGREDWHWRGRACDVCRAPDAVSVEAAFHRHAGFELTGTFDAEHVDRSALSQRAAAAGLALGADDTWSDIFSRVMVERIEPRLGSPAPTILHHYPTHEAALARRDPARAEVAERFELYACGVELANGFGELTDPVEQRARLEAEMTEKSRIYGERYPIDEDFLAALAQMPPASGCALGFDRLVLLATGATHIDAVQWTPG